MIKIIVSEGIDNIKNELLSIKDEVCIVHDRKGKNNYVITFNKNLDLIKSQLTIIDVKYYSDDEKIKFIISQDDIEIFGRKDFLQ